MNNNILCSSLKENLITSFTLSTCGRTKDNGLVPSCIIAITTATVSCSAVIYCRDTVVWVEDFSLLEKIV